jgi:hypothetical protein
MPPGTQTLFLRSLAAKRSRASAFWRSSQARVVPSQARFTADWARRTKRSSLVTRERLPSPYRIQTV